MKKTAALRQEEAARSALFFRSLEPTAQPALSLRMLVPGDTTPTQVSALAAPPRSPPAGSAAGILFGVEAVLLVESSAWTVAAFKLLNCVEGGEAGLTSLAEAAGQLSACGAQHALRARGADRS